MKTILKTKILTVMLGVSAALLSYSCYEDLGNYDYQDINEITITGLPSKIEILEREKITVIPTLASTLSGNEDNYSYAWIAIRINTSIVPGSKVLDTIARTRTLENFVVPLLPNDYEIHYRVTDNTTNIYSEATFKLAVKTKIYEGFLVMNDIDGAMRLDMLSYRDDQFYFIKDVLTEVGSELPPQQGPLGIAIFDDLRSPSNLAIYLLTETDANRIEPETFHYDPIYNIRYHFLPGTYMAGFTPKSIKGGTGVLLYGEDAQGKGAIYNYVRINNFSWSVKVNTLDNGVTFFDPSPVFATSHARGGIIFDNDTKSFYKVSVDQVDISKSTLLPEGDTVSFVNTGKDLLYMTNIDQEVTKSYYKTILKDNSNTCFFLSFSDLGAQDRYEQIMAADIYQAEHFAVGGEFYDKYIFYSIGGKVYVYDIPNKISTLVIDKGSDSHITLMEFHKFYGAHRFSNPFYYYNLKNKLIVCSYNNATKEGKMELYYIPNIISGMMTMPVVYEGFGNIVSIHYRER